MHNVARLVMTLLLIVVLGSGFRWLSLNWHQLTSAEAEPSQGLDLTAFWNTTLTDPAGKQVALASFKGKPLIINFWATWCEPCRDEMPEISALATAHPESAVVGLAIDEVAAVHEFNESTPVSYPLLIAENEGMPLAEQLGNNKGVLPFTVVLNANGQISQTFFGRVNRAMLEKALNASAH